MTHQPGHIDFDKAISGSSGRTRTPKSTKGQGSGLIWPLAAGTFRKGDGPGAMRRGTPSHGGQDFITSLGAPVYATEDYEVVKVQPWDRGRPPADRAGHYLVLKGLKTRKKIRVMQFMDWSTDVFKGAIIRQGQAYARAGNTGNASDENAGILHMEVREPGSRKAPGGRIDP